MPKSKIVFASDRTSGVGVNNPEGDLEIFTMNPDGTGLKQLTKNAASDTKRVFSASGKKIAFTSYRGGDNEIYTMKAKPEGSKNRPKNLTKNSVKDFAPDWQQLVS